MATGPRPVKRFGLAAAILVFAVFAIGSGADRLSENNPALAAKVPALFASAALRSAGAQALGNGKALGAAAIGARAINNAPTDPQSTALFGAGLLGKGDRVLSERAFRVAGQLGWRVPITQSYWMGQALAEGKYDIAALRLDALLRQQPYLLRERALTDPMERNPAGVTAMIARMQARPVWLRYYAFDVYDLPADIALQRAAVLDQAARSGLILGCEQIAPLAARLAAVSQVRVGAALWHQHCPAAGTGLVSDERLSTLDIAATPTAFGWELIGNGELSLAVTPSSNGGGKRLTISGTADLPRAVLAQLVVLDPGRYVLSWRTGNDQGRPSDHVLAGLGCPEESPSWLSPTLDKTSGLWRAQVEIGAQCPARRLVFAAAPGSGQVWLEQITLVRTP